MSEKESTSSTPADSVEPGDTAAEIAEPVPAERSVKRRRVVMAAGSALLAAAVVAGVGTTVVAVRDADRDAGAPAWQFPDAKAEQAKAAPQGGLGGMLLPYGGNGGWTRGPDLGEFGSDAQLSGAQATALRKKSLSDLPRSQRRQLEEQIDKQRIQGMAMRSYYSRPTDQYTHHNQGVFALSVVLSQLDSSAAVREIARFQSEFLDALKVFRKGPEIKGHKNARCFLPPENAKADLDRMFCSAYVGDVLVTARADGAKPLDTGEVAEFLRTQLDRIAEPGAAA
ncbi:hypothetical protein [Streptomyces sp. NPDC002328]|uniref:hypothetical protein n=1 Tax=Streptomyces sp. NPDC002328 TaxID=3364642 RepID=UPI00368B5F41